MTLILTWLWQGLAIVWTIQAAVWTMPRLNAATRHVIWWLALAAVLSIPAAHGVAAITTSQFPAADVASLNVNADARLMLPAIPAGIVAWAAAFWAMRAALGILQIAASYRALGRLKRAASPFDRSREARLRLWVAARASGHRSAELRISDGIAGACAVGFGRPVILISRFVADSLGDESLDEIVMHEQAHLDRHDDWTQLLLAVIGALFGLHPAVRFLARRLDVDREAACDDRVVSSTQAARHYASSLLAVAAATNPQAGAPVFAAGAPAAMRSMSALRVRIDRLLDTRRDRGARVATAASLVSVTALAFAVVLSTQAAPLVVFLEKAAVSSPDAIATPTKELRQEAPVASRMIMNVRVEQSVRRTPVRTGRPKRAVAADAAAAIGVSIVQDAPAAPLERRTLASADTVAPVLEGSIPSSEPAAVASPPAPVAKPWDALTASATTAASDLTRAAKEHGGRARSAGLSISRFVTRVGKAAANVY